MRSLSVKVINKTTNEIINDIEPHILLDDSVRKIKEKLLYFNTFIPNLIKLEIKQETNTFIKIKDSNDLLFEYYDIIPEEPIIYLTSLELDDQTLKKCNVDTQYCEETFNKLKDDYIDLTQEDFTFFIREKMMELLGADLNTNDITDTSVFGDDYINTIQNNITTIEKDISDEFDESFKKFFDKAKGFDPESQINNIAYNDISLVITGNNVDVNGGSKSLFIKLNDIYNKLELTEQIPFIALGKKGFDVRYPQIKINNKLLDTISDKEIKSWVLNEKKKLNEASYKIIKGLLIKSKFENSSNYVTINILLNGVIYANISLPDSTDDLRNILDKIKQNVNNVVQKLNLLDNVFLQSKRIALIQDSEVHINSLDTLIETNVFIDRINFESLILQETMSNKLLEKKLTDSQDVLSAYYKKYKSRETIDDIKGITINIKDNPYEENSSIIKILGADNQNQSLIILWTILILNELASEGTSEVDVVKRRKIQQKSKLKKLHARGVFIDSKKCQKSRQPEVSEEVSSPSTPSQKSIITFNDLHYTCKNPVYPYPGFVEKEMVCCFKKNQKRTENYLNNMDPDSLNILAEPSNFIINVTEPGTSNTFETFVIKIISEYLPGYNESDMPIYYYLSNTLNDLSSKNEIIPIRNKELIKQLDSKDNIWLEPVPLSNIIYPSSTNICNHPPDLNNRTTLHSPCEKHPSHKFFGYNSKSIPCCFENKKEAVLSTNVNKTVNLTKQYIIQSSDKLLSNKQIGILPNDISNIISFILPNSEYYKMGVIQNHYSFLNAVLLSINNKIKDTSLPSYLEFKKYISDNLTKELFNKLNNGDISIKYLTIERYLNYINSDTINWEDLIDIIEILTGINILILDKGAKETRLLCKRTKINLTKPFIVLLKRRNTFEILIEIIKHKKSDNELITEYNSTNPLITFLIDYYKDTCIKENRYPEKYPYKHLFTYDFINNIIKTNFKNLYIRYQVKNSFNKINMVMLNNGVLIPIIEMGIINVSTIKIVSIIDVIKQNRLRTLDYYIKTFKLLNKILNDSQKITIKGTLDHDEIGAIFTDFGVALPYKKSDLDKDYAFTKLDFKYYIEDEQIDEQINGYANYNKSYDELRTLLFDIKKFIGEKVSTLPEVKSKIEKLVLSSTITKGEKIKLISSIFKTFNLPKDYQNETLLKSIANEIINDNKEQLILNNIIVSETFNTNDVIKRDDESILLNINDIRRWINKYKKNH